jgi:hypothetical protein
VALALRDFIDAHHLSYANILRIMRQKADLQRSTRDDLTVIARIRHRAGDARDGKDVALHLI